MTQNDLRKKYPYYDQIQRFRLIDDTFMSVVFQDIGCTQFLIRILLQNDGLNVTEVGTQNSLKNLRGRSVRLDIIAYDKQGKIYNIEVQRKDAGALPKRARYNSSMMDANITRPGEGLENLPETYVIFITENDYFQSALPLYHIDRTVRELSAPFQDEAHIIYVNGQYRGEDPIGSVMHDFFCADPKSMNNAILANEVAKYKESACSVDYETVIKADVKTARELFKRPLVYIFHDTIDAASHGAGAGDVIAACRKAIEQLAVLVRRLHASWNVTNVVLTADHGFLYNDVEFAEKDKHAVTVAGIIEKKTRYYVSDQVSAQEGVVTMPLDKVSGMKAETPIYIGVPMGTNRLAASGGYSFAHGGATLQEMLIPVIHSSQKRSDKTNKVGVALVDHNLVMVSSRLKFQLIQSEAVSMTVVERKVVCQVYQGDTPVTGKQTIMLDSADTINLNNRVYEVVLILNHSVHSGMLQLRVYDEEDCLNPLIREVVKNNTMIEQDF